jgi:hypothetical protein
MTEQQSKSRRTTGGAAGTNGRAATGKPAGATGSKAPGATSAVGTKKPTGSANAAAGATRSTGAAAPNPAAGDAKTPMVRFTGDWREDIVGDVRAGVKLRVEYAPDRLPGNGKSGVIAEVMFSPGGQHHTGRVTGGRFDITVPDDAREMTIWFHRTEGGATSWDSRFGANYSFPVQAGASKSANRRPASAA